MHKWYIPFLCKVSKGGNPFNYYYSADDKWVLSFPTLRCITRSRRTLPQYRQIYRAETYINSVYNIFNMHPALQVSCFLSSITDHIILWRAKWNIQTTFMQSDIFHSYNSIFNRTLFPLSFTFWDSSLRLHYRWDKWGIKVWFLTETREFLFSINSDWLWDPFSSLFSRCWRTFPHRESSHDVRLTHQLMCWGYECVKLYTSTSTYTFTLRPQINMDNFVITSLKLLCFPSSVKVQKR